MSCSPKHSPNEAPKPTTDELRERQAQARRRYKALDDLPAALARLEAAEARLEALERRP